MREKKQITWLKVQRDLQKQNGKTLFAYGLSCLTSGTAIQTGLIDKATAWKLFNFVMLIYRGTEPRAAFDEAFWDLDIKTPKRKKKGT